MNTIFKHNNTFSTVSTIKNSWAVSSMHSFDKTSVNNDILKQLNEKIYG